MAIAFDRTVIAPQMDFQRVERWIRWVPGDHNALIRRGGRCGFRQWQRENHLVGALIRLL
jgi:hypothetical protein